ncbi:ABC transporter permease subunit [Bacillus sp. CRN 9]|nr:ABC transporter permease subunit [Bacillus sp. CRN 9]
MIIIGFIGHYIAPYDLNYSKEIQYVGKEDNFTFEAPPFKPSRDHLFGTDQWGYDLLTKILHGAKYTIFTVLILSFLRLLFGTFIGTVIGLNRNKFKINYKKTISLFSGLPSFLVIYFIMIGINFNSSLSINQLILVISLLIISLGLPNVSNIVNNNILVLKKELYIEASKVLGGSDFHILLVHILPSLKNKLYSLYISECIQILQLLGQLAIFNIFFGGTIVQEFPTIFFSSTNEWAGLIGQSRSNIYANQWILIFPLICYFLLLLTFYLIYYGLKHKNKLYKNTHL